MENLYWILWTILGAILIVAEVFTAGFVLLMVWHRRAGRGVRRHSRHQ